MKKSVIIVGGGITGLSAAYFLKTKLNFPCDVHLFEKGMNVGGQIQTVRRDGYTIETGPESFVWYKPAGVQLCRNLNLGDSLIEPKPDQRRTFMLHKGRLENLPDGIFSPFSQPLLKFWKTFAFTPLLSWRGKVRMALEPLVFKKTNDVDESLKSFIHRRLGSEFYENLLSPLISGVYGGDPSNLSTRVVLREYHDAELKSGSILMTLIKNGFATARNGSSPSATKSVFTTLSAGLSTLVEGLSKFLPSDSLHLQSGVRAIQREKLNFRVLLDNGTSLKADAILLSTPAHASAKLLEASSPQLAEELSRIPYSSSLVLSMAFARDAIEHPLNGYGFIVALNEKLSFTACTWTSSKWFDRAPPGQVLLRIYVPGKSNQADPVTNQVLNELGPILGVRSKPLFMLVHPHPDSLPQYVVGHERRLQTLGQLLKNRPGLFLAGAAYHGLGIPDCIQDAQNAAMNLAQYLQGNPVLSKEAF